MFRPLAFFIASRYSAPGGGSWAVSFLSWVTLLGMALGVAVLVVVLSVTNGFETQLRERMLSMISHATISSWQGDLRDWQSQLTLAQQQPGVIAAAPFIQRETLLRSEEEASGVLVRGITPQAEQAVAGLARHVRDGELGAIQAGEFRIILGHALARRLGVGVGDEITLFAPEVRVTPAGIMPLAKRFQVVALLDVGMQQFDDGIALVHMQDAARLFRVGDAISGIRLRVDELLRSREIAAAVSERMGPGLRVEDWSEQNVNLFRAVAKERVMLFMLLSLIIAVAGFNIVSALVMSVNDKRADIAILRTQGASAGLVLRIFVVKGLLLGVAGLVLGLLAGVLLTWNLNHVVAVIEALLNIEVMSGEVYYITGLPVQLRAADLGLISLAAVAVSFLATLYPSWRAACVQPAEALRYE
jgi:lipoprotein-releasing system permease protein